jgi:hypothetical protein
MGFFLVMKAELVRTFIIMRRYWFQTITGMFIGYMMLLMLVLGFMYGGRDAGALADKLSSAETGTSWALSFILGMFAFGILGMFTQGLQQLAQSGQLEQLCMSPHGLATNFMARTLVSSISSVFTSALMVWLIAKTVGGTLHADFPATATLLALTFFNLIGFGFMVGGLVLVFKQTGQVALIIRLAMFALAILATDKIDKLHPVLRWAAHSLPITDAAICIKYVLIQGQMRPVLDSAGKVLLNAAGKPQMYAMSVFVHPSFYLLLISCVVWTVIGISCFRFMENWSRDKGTLGAY